MNGKRMLALFLTISVSTAAVSILAEGAASGPAPDPADLPTAESSALYESVTGQWTLAELSEMETPPVTGDPEADEALEGLWRDLRGPEPEPVPEEDATLPDPVDTPEASVVAGPDDGGNRPAAPLTESERKDARKRESIVGSSTETAEPLSEIAFEQVEGRAREDNLTVRAMRENVAGLEGIDYEKSEEDLLKALNGLAAQESALQLAANEPLAQTFAVSSLRTQYDSLYDTFEKLRDGTTRRDSRDAIEQLNNAMDQVVMGAETLYIALIAMRDQHTALNRQLDSLNRSVEELELRYRLGQVSALTLNQAKSGRTALLSGIRTLEMNIRTYKMQLENMLGASLTGEIRLGELPAVTEQQIAALDVTRDFAAAHEKSYELYSAARTLQDARETFLSSGDKYHYNDNNASYTMAKHTWTAAQDTYNVTVRGYELKFRTLSEQVHDYYQVWNASKEALEAQKLEYQAKELQYKQGNISQNTLLSAKDALNEKEEAVRTAANNLFSSYNNYCWAVQTGILN
ncbi:MAG: TolC family protein [Oscillibacter sp.]|nr:TolC family protein [Oscillibacter sp.]